MTAILIRKALPIALAISLAALAAFYSFISNHWPMLREAHFLHYMAYLIDVHNYRPYWDALDTSWYGTFLYHIGIGRLFGYHDQGFRTADLIAISLLIFTSFNALKNFGNLPATIAALSAALCYLSFGPANSLQRDFVLMLPIIASLWVAQAGQLTAHQRSLLIGLLFSLSASIKPQCIVFAPIVFYLSCYQLPTQKILPCLLLATATGIIGLFFGLGWLASKDALDGFIWMNKEFLPIYQDFGREHALLSTDEKISEAKHWWSWHTNTFLAIFFICSLRLISLRKFPQQFTLAAALLILTAISSFYPMIAQKYWDYHWLPYYVSASLCSAILLINTPTTKVWQSGILILLFCLANIKFWLPATHYQGQIKQGSFTVNTNEEALVALIRSNLQKNDAIQLIDQGGYTYNVALKAQAPHATRFLDLLALKQAVNRPETQALQQEFLTSLAQKPPKLILQRKNLFVPKGPYISAEIPGLKNFIDQHYELIFEEDRSYLWRLKNH